MQPYKLKAPLVVDLYEDEFPVDWAGMNPKPYRAILQCTKGQFHRDIRCETYFHECKALGIKYGLYHFLFPNNIDEQVEFYKQVVTDLGGLGHFPPVVDVEQAIPREKPGHPDNLPRGKNWADQIKVWLDATETWSLQKPMIYTNASFWEYTFDRMGNPPDWTDQYPLWVAWYPRPISNVDQREKPRDDRMPAGWTKWAMWQYSDRGRTDGYLANDYSVATPEYAAELDIQFI